MEMQLFQRCVCNFLLNVALQPLTRQPQFLPKIPQFHATEPGPSKSAREWVMFLQLDMVHSWLSAAKCGGLFI